MLSSTLPSSCPGRFTKNGTAATCSKLLSLTWRRSLTPTSNAMPWSATTTNSARSKMPVRFIRSMIRPSWWST